MSNIQNTHDSYGTLSFNRAYGGLKNLFGSSVQHKNTITMELHQASIERKYNEDFIYPKKLIAKVEMSQSQFAEVITSFGVGSGVPVTIRYVRDEGYIEPCEFISKQDQFLSEFEEHTKNALEKANTLLSEVESRLMNKRSFTKKDKEDLKSLIIRLYNDINSNIPFILSQFNEQMDNTVKEAKGEIEAFCQNKINSMAQQAMSKHKDDLLTLKNPVEIKN